MRYITITGEWLNSFSKLERPVRVAQLFKLAEENKWVIRVSGMHWNA
jgi:hypothetical protein